MVVIYRDDARFISGEPYQKRLVDIFRRDEPAKRTRYIVGPPIIPCRTNHRYHRVRKPSGIVRNVHRQTKRGGVRATPPRGGGFSRPSPGGVCSLRSPMIDGWIHRIQVGVPLRVTLDAFQPHPERGVLRLDFHIDIRTVPAPWTFDPQRHVVIGHGFPHPSCAPQRFHRRQRGMARTHVRVNSCNAHRATLRRPHG
jgi:hypothetical protein